MDKDIQNKDVRKKLYIKLYYSMLDWEWYDDPNTFRVFMHLLFIANRKDQPYHGDVIHRGEVLASNAFLAKSLKISIQSVKTAIAKLKKTGEITRRKIGKVSVIRIVNYIYYQDGNFTSTSKQPENNLNATSKKPESNLKPTTLIDCKNDKSVRLKECECHTRTYGKHKNILLTKDEYERFRERYPLIADNVIEELSDKVATGDPKYQTGHIGHLYVFARNYKPKQQDKKPSFDIDLALQRSLNLDPTKTKNNS